VTTSDLLYQNEVRRDFKLQVNQSLYIVFGARYGRTAQSNSNKYSRKECVNDAILFYDALLDHCEEQMHQTIYVYGKWIDTVNNALFG